MEYCPFRLPFNVSSRLTGGTAISCKTYASFSWISFLRATLEIPEYRELFPVSYRASVSEFLNEVIKKPAD